MQPPWAIEVDHLSFAYEANRKALSQVSLRLAQGETVGLIGPNGAGKTSLFLCMSGVLGIEPGQVQVLGLDPAERSNRRKLPEKVGIVFQNSDDQLFNPTVFDDVAFGPLNLGCSADEVKQRVTEALDSVGLPGYEERVPFHLSGGEKRRVALAGVLAMRPDVLLLDEPTMHLDPRSRRELIHLLRQLSGSQLIASHDLEMVLELCSRVVLLDHGTVITEGCPRTLFSDAELMEKHGLEVPYSLR